MQLITESQTSVTALFFYHGVKEEIELWKKAEQSPPLSEDEKQKILQKCKISISKYAKAILLCKSFMRSNSSLEILIVGDQETYQVQEVEKETFALIRLKGISVYVSWKKWIALLSFGPKEKLKKIKTYGIRISHENTVKRHPAL